MDRKRGDSCKSFHSHAILPVLTLRHNTVTHSWFIEPRRIILGKPWNLYFVCSMLSFVFVMFSNDLYWPCNWKFPSCRYRSWLKTIMLIIIYRLVMSTDSWEQLLYSSLLAFLHLWKMELFLHPSSSADPKPPLLISPICSFSLVAPSRQLFRATL